MDKDIYRTMSTMPKRLLPISFGFLVLILLGLSVLFYAPIIPYSISYTINDSSKDNSTLNIDLNTLNINSSKSIKAIYITSESNSMNQEVEYNDINRSNKIDLLLPKEIEFHETEEYYVNIEMKKSLLSYLIYK